MSADPARQVVVDALDELGERDTLSYEQRTAADEPYPPPVVEERLKTLRRSQRILRVFLGVVAGLVTLLLAGADVGWPLLRSLVGFELLPLVPPILLAVYKLVEEGKAEQLYALLARVDETTDPEVV